MSLDSNEYSFLKVKVHLIFLSSFLYIFLFVFSKNNWIIALSFVFMAFNSFYIIFVRCERCGGYAYRKGDLQHGFPKLNWEHVDDACPTCGMKRYSLLEGMLVIMNRVKKTFMKEPR